MLAALRKTTHARFSLAWWEEIRCEACDEAGTFEDPCTPFSGVVGLKTLHGHGVLRPDLEAFDASQRRLKSEIMSKKL
ncbi:hypothetical protein IEQ34_017528 [Dendrobium chrysotoxum]|uniref:Uncharacterized protein n=1 Tax=Dendrobium chrysotoxum TaxID=161865 RepID=A0AAV7GBJ8_DENCH|nr:hypothetical protein IEQ34_017528 [Dendrobium chrysotoxum]